MLTLLIASPFEAAPFIKGLKKINEMTYEGDYKVIISGTGLIAMSEAITGDLITNSAEKFLNIGIAGAVNDSYETAQILKPESFNIFSSVDIPENSINIWQNSYPEIGKPGISLFTSLHPVWNETDKQKLTSLNADLLDMEGYAFAKICTDYKADFEVIKAVSDNLIKETQQDFLFNARQAIDKSYEYFTQNYLT